MMRQQPRSLTVAMALLGLLVAVGAVTVALTALLRDTLILNWAEGHRSAREILETRGLDYLKSNEPIVIPQFFPVAAVLFVVLAMLIAVLVVFLRDSHNWARVSLTVLVVMIAVATIGGIRIDPPAVFVAISYLALALDIGLLVALWHRDTNTYMRGVEEAPAAL
ncbi:hypothetical protein [Nocardioides kribbensis]|uniref:hypothetical protein n=1 Tax=Nocardioides kribbensis TaxID=305517 RepID=UPI001879DC1A|nr:hypothetical protein [Nocardioides kribbensis]